MRNSKRGASATGFTLVELLVVIAIIGLLVAMLLPAVQLARDAARRTSCVNNLRQIGAAIQMYHNNHSSFPPGGVSYGNCCSSESFTSWTIQILPYLEWKSLYDTYRQDEFNESKVNKSIRQHYIPTYSCPADVERSTLSEPASGPAHNAKLDYMPGSYRGVGGKSDGSNWWDNNYPSRKPLPRRWRGVFHVMNDKLKPESMSGVLDGLSNTIMVGESTMRPSTFAPKHPLSRRTYWAYTFGSYNRSDAVAESRTLLGDWDRCNRAGGQGGSETCNHAWGSMHPDLLNFLLCDGAVHTFSVSMDMQIFADSATIAGKEFAPLP